MRPLIAQSGMPCIADCQTVQPTWKRRAQILVELCDVYFFISVCDIYLFLIKQERTVVIKAFDTALFPRSCNGFGSIQIRFSCVICRKADIERPIMVTYGSRPHPFSIYILIPFKPLCGRAVQSVIHKSRVFPVHQIIRAQNLAAWHEMHGGCHHVINLSDSNHIRIGIVQF